MAGIGRIPEFDPSEDNFGTYSRRVEQYFIANGVKEEDDVRRRAIFLSVVGGKVFSLLEDLIAPAKVDSISYKDIIKILLDHFEPAPSAIAARYHFNRATRQVGESHIGLCGQAAALGKALRLPECDFGRDAERSVRLRHAERTGAGQAPERGGANPRVGN